MVNKGNCRSVCGLQGPGVTRWHLQLFFIRQHLFQDLLKGLSHTDGRFVVDVVMY